jgi:hypothetical protein
MEILPNFIICGTQKGGTTALYHYLNEHPEICIPKKKEIHYFDLNYHRGVEWYGKNFIECQNEKAKAIGEASPLYMYLEEVPERIKEFLPNIKLIFILRNPVNRAYSHYWHEVKLGYEHLSFEEAIKEEKKRLAIGGIFNNQHFSYKDRGKYIIQLKKFRKYFPYKQMLVLINEELKENPEYNMKRVFEFLGVDTTFISPNWRFQHYKGKQPRIWKLQRIKTILPNTVFGNGVRYLLDRINLKNGYTPINPDTRETLLNYFESYNNDLSRFLRKKLGAWHI